jgi:hypothetical protein
MTPDWGRLALMPKYAWKTWQPLGLRYGINQRAGK